LSDVDGLVRHAQSRDTELPVFVLGHSAGGVLACLYAVDHQTRLAGLICESFAFQTPAPDVALAVLKGLGHIFPHAHVLHLKNEDFSRDPDVVAAMNADPLIAHETQPTQTVAELVRADERLKNEFSRITLPVLILHGTSDRAAKASGSQVFFDACVMVLGDDHVRTLTEPLIDLGPSTKDDELRRVTSFAMMKEFQPAIQPQRPPQRRSRKSSGKNSNPPSTMSTSTSTV